MKTKGEDYHLIMGCLANDRKSQRNLYNKYSPLLLGVCMRYAKNMEDAEDILIEGFMKIFTGLNGFKNDSSLKSWMYKIMINTAINYLKRNEKHHHTTQIIEETLVDETTVLDDIPESISRKELVEQMQKMPEHFRTVLNLIALDGYSYETVSAYLSIPEATVRSRLSKAKQYLHKQFYKQ